MPDDVLRKTLVFEGNQLSTSSGDLYGLSIWIINKKFWLCSVTALLYLFETSCRGTEALPR